MDGGRVLRGLSDRYVVAHRRSIPTLKRRTVAGFHILTYHRIQPTQQTLTMGAFLLDHFEQQVAYLAKYYRLMTLGQVMDAIREGRLPDGAVCLTFDDGYRDVYDHALPVLRRYRAPATVFLATGSIGTGTPLWYDQIFEALRRSRVRRLLHPLDHTEIRLDSEQEKHELALRLIERLKGEEETARKRGVQRILHALKIPVAADNRLMLDWDLVRRLQKAGIEFGSHTDTHPILSRLSPSKVWSELVRSKTVIEDHCQREATLFAYPNGKPEDYTPEVVEMVKRAGYRAAVTTLFGTNHVGDDPYHLKRGTPWETSVRRFGMKLAWYRMQDAHPG